MTNQTFTLTSAATDMRVLATTADAVYLRLPRELQRSCEHCCCEHCKKDPASGHMWDTLVVPVKPAKSGARYSDWHTWTCHMPDGAVPAFREYLARQAAAKKAS